MKIAITSSGSELKSTIQARFGRCAFFIIIDPDTMLFETIENPNIALGYAELVDEFKPGELLKHLSSGKG